MKRPEVLAPAGDAVSLRAAIQAGADAVYFGLEQFNARARASNFSSETLAETMAELHRHGVKGYVTLNTLVFDSELLTMEQTIRTCASAGVDAVIVQDLGVATLVRRIAPEMPIHASTQMTCTDADAVEFAHDLGAHRVILARELTVQDIAQIRERTAVELEVFVHGALCVAYSGQCLTSEAIGGRSANRGACAQSCRLPYDLIVDGKVQPMGEDVFLLSPEDLEASTLVQQLTDIGVSSLKIEGRLKGPAYVAATTRLYRAALDGVADLDELRTDAAQTFSRGNGPGFLAGIDHQRFVEGRGSDHRGLLAGECLAIEQHRSRTWARVRTQRALALGDGVLIEGGRAGADEFGGRIWAFMIDGHEVSSVSSDQEVLIGFDPQRTLPASALLAGHRVFKSNDPQLERRILRGIEEDPHRQDLSIHVEARLDEYPQFVGKIADRTVSVLGDTKVALAKGSATDEPALREKLGRLGETPFVLKTITTQLDPDTFIAPAVMNRARRAIVEALNSAPVKPWECTDVTSASLLEEVALPAKPPTAKGQKLMVLCRNLSQAHAAIDAGCDEIYLDFLELTGTGEAVRLLRERGPTPIGLTPPRIRKPGEEKIERYLQSLNPEKVLIRSLGALRSWHPSGSERIGDFSLNITNRISAATVLARGLSAFTPAFDLDATQLEAMMQTGLAAWAEIVVHHPMPLFHTEHCVIAATLSQGKDHRDCGRPCDRHQLSLRDRAGMIHPVEADVGCRNTIFHAAAQSAAGLVATLLTAGVERFRIELVRESAEDVRRIVSEYRALLQGQRTARDLWRTLKADGHYGVVKGSLRVLNA